MKPLELTDRFGYMLFYHPYVGIVEQFQLKISSNGALLDEGHIIFYDNWYYIASVSYMLHVKQADWLVKSFLPGFSFLQFF